MDAIDVGFLIAVVGIGGMISALFLYFFNRV